MRDAGIRQPLGSFDERLQTAPTEATTWSDGVEGSEGCGGSEAKPWKVKIARGGYLDSNSASDDGIRSDNANASNQHRVLRRLKLIASDDEERGSSVATTKVTSFTFQNKIQTSCHSSQYGDASDHKMGASRRDEMQRQGGVRRLSVDKSDSDDDSVKQMEFMTHTFQRHDNGANGRYKSKPGPLCFGVDVKSPLEEEGAATPRNASCSFSSVIGEILGVTPPRSGNTPTRTSLSPLVDVMKSIICSPDRMPNTGSAKKMTKRRSQKANNDDDWSVGVDVRSEYSDDRSASYVQSEVLSMPPRAKQYTKPPRTPPRRADRNRPKSGVETLQDKYDQSLTYRQFHREDLSYYGTEITSVYHPPTKYSCDEDDDRSDTVSRSFDRSPRLFRQRPSYRNSPLLQDKTLVSR
ncbi:hypothetical protein ACHAXT_010042 [Thalassiosira profunda]